MEARQERLSAENRKYFDFIAELRKAAAEDSPTDEISRVYKEVADILAEAFDEYNPTDLPKYQVRLDNIIKLTRVEPQGFEDPLFKQDLAEAKELLDKKVKERFGTYKKIATLANMSLRGLGSISTHVQDVIDMGDRAQSAGRALGSMFNRPKIDPEEERRQYDLIRGNPGQYGNHGPGGGNPNAPIGPIGAGGAGNIVSVKDDKVLGSNTTQNKVLIQLFNVTKDSNADIKQIKALLKREAIERSQQYEDAKLDALEAAEESSRAKVASASTIFGSRSGSAMPGGSAEGDGSGEGGGMSLADEYVLYRGAKAAWQYGKQGVGAAFRYGKAGLGYAADAALAGGTALAESTVALPVAATAAATYVGLKAAPTVARSYTDSLRSLGATIGERTKGLDYYKHELQRPLEQGGIFDPEGPMRSAENNEADALNYLERVAKEKRELFDEAYRDGSVYGSGKYEVNGEPAKMDEAIHDVREAEEMAKKYAEYLEAKHKQGGGGLSPTAIFRHDGKTYRNPLYNPEELGQQKVGQNFRHHNQRFRHQGRAAESRKGIAKKRSDYNLSSVGKSISKEGFENDLITEKSGDVNVESMQANAGMDDSARASIRPDLNTDPLKSSASQESMPDAGPDGSGFDSFLRGITAAETKPITEERGMYDPSRFVRTTGGAASSAYGPQQITLTLARNNLNKGMFDDDPELKQWVGDKFVPQAKKFLHSSYSDPKYGSGGQGDLNTADDRKMYQKMSERILRDTYDRNNGNVMAAAGEWHYGYAHRNELSSRDPKYAPRIMAQMRRDRRQQEIQMASKADVSPLPQGPSQVALNRLNTEVSMNRSKPTVIPIPMGGGKSGGEAQSGVSTKSVGASPNGASEASLMCAIRSSTSTLS